LFHNYLNEHVKYSQLIEQFVKPHIILEEDLVNKLVELERNASIYIERYPKLTIKDKLRKTIDVNDVIYFDCFPLIKRKSLLYETDVEYSNYACNHLFCCAHGCTYPCYAFRQAKRYKKVKDYEQWLHPRIVGNALQLLDEEIPLYKDKIESVHLSFTTDPFMYDALNQRTIPWIEDHSLKIIEKLNKNELPVTTLTKGFYPEKLADEKFNSNNWYGITLVSISEEYRQQHEPFSAPIDVRIGGVKLFADQGRNTWISMEPWSTPNMFEQDIEDVLNEISFAKVIIFGKMNYNPTVSGYKKKERFYKRCAEKVIEFCLSNGIQYYIKKGTPLNDRNTNCVLIKNTRMVNTTVKKTEKSLIDFF
jgi:DNA repair photolyase